MTFVLKSMQCTLLIIRCDRCSQVHAMYDALKSMRCMLLSEMRPMFSNLNHETGVHKIVMDQWKFPKDKKVLMNSMGDLQLCAGRSRAFFVYYIGISKPTGCEYVSKVFLQMIKSAPLLIWRHYESDLRNSIPRH